MANYSVDSEALGLCQMTPWNCNGHGFGQISPCTHDKNLKVRLPEGDDCLQALKKRGIEFSFLAPQHMACQDAIARIGRAFVAAQVRSS